MDLILEDIFVAVKNTIKSFCVVNYLLLENKAGIHYKPKLDNTINIKVRMWNRIIYMNTILSAGESPNLIYIKYGWLGVSS